MLDSLFLYANDEVMDESVQTFAGGKKSLSVILNYLNNKNNFSHAFDPNLIQNENKIPQIFTI